MSSPIAGERQDADGERHEPIASHVAGRQADVVDEDRGHADEDQRRQRRQIGDCQLGRDPRRRRQRRDPQLTGPAARPLLAIGTAFESDAPIIPYAAIETMK